MAVLGRGRKARPRNLVLVESGRDSRTARNLDDDEPQPPVEAPPPPEFLQGPARDAFVMFAAKLAQLKVMTAADCEACVLLAQSWADWLEACAKVAAEPLQYAGESGYMTPSPWVAIKNRAWTQVTQLLVEFGLTPSARRKVAVVKPQPR